MKEKFLKEQKRLSESCKVLLAVSGGPDSMAMLHLFHELKLDLQVVHLNHQIRGKEAADDARFVEEESRKRGIPVRIFSFDVPRFALRQKLSMEEAGRRIRRHFFTRFANLNGIEVIALAHTSDDHAETIFMNFLRGAGPRGLAGIFPKQGRFIHPMLSFTKQEILDYLNENGIAYRVDASNEELHYFRNRIRKEIFPFLETKINHDLKSAIARVGEIMQEEEEWLSELVGPIFLSRYKKLKENFHELRIEKEEFPKALLRRLIRMLIESSVGELRSISLAQVEAIIDLLGKENGKRFLAPAFLIEKNRNGLLLARMEKHERVASK